MPPGTGQNRPGAFESMPRPPNTDPAKQIEALLRERRVLEAEQLASASTHNEPGRFDLWLMYARVCQHKGDLAGMLAHAEKAVRLSPQHIGAHMVLTEARLQNGQIKKALQTLSRIRTQAKTNVPLLQALAELYTHAGRHKDAQACYRQARELDPSDPRLAYNLATSAMAMGDMDEAETLLDEVIAKTPHDYDAYYNRATLRRQTPDSNHVDQIVKALNAGQQHPMGAVQLYYALAKELEDLGRYSESFSALTKGAKARRSLLSYRLEDDVATIDQIISTFTREVIQSIEPGRSSSAPIFILGLPRSGTTLVDRILSAHSKVDSLGEINDFALALTRQAGPVTSKEQLVRSTAELDFNALGQDYTRSAAGRGVRATHLIDKTPANFLYLGLIALALPNAKIIHLRRHPMDSCYAIYKTLFRMGYPYSYSLDDLGAYYLAYHRLMAHWRNVLPGRFLDVDYEALVADQESVSREIVAACGLDWESASLDFYKQDGAAATASAAQVRQPIYSTSVALWQRYEEQLAPLATVLKKGGVPL